MKKLFLFLTIFLPAAVILALLPSVVMADSNQIVYGTITGVDTATNQITIAPDYGPVKSLTLNGADLLYGSQPIDLSELQPGERLGSYGQVSGAGMGCISVVIEPATPTYQNITGVVTGISGAGITVQTPGGPITCTGGDAAAGIALLQQQGVTMVVQTPPDVNAGNYITTALSGGATIKPEITSFQPLTQTITNIGQNLQQAPAGSSTNAGDVAVQIANTLGVITDNLPEGTKTTLQTQMSDTIGSSMPSTAWTGMNAGSGASISPGGVGFIPSQAFGQMPAQTFSTISPGTVGSMSPEDFVQMNQQDFSQLSSSARDQIPAGVTIPTAPTVSGAPPVPTGPINPPTTSGVPNNPPGGVTTPPSGVTTPTPPSGGMPTTPPSGVTTPTPPSGGMPTTPPSGITTPTPPSGGMPTTPPSGVTTPTPPSGGMPTTPPSGVTTPTPPSGDTTPTPPSGGSTPTPPSGGGAPTPPSGGGAPTPPSGGGAPTPPAGH
jgi:hypothetical protein